MKKLEIIELEDGSFEVRYYEKISEVWEELDCDNITIHRYISEAQRSYIKSIREKKIK